MLSSSLLSFCATVRQNSSYTCQRQRLLASTPYCLALSPTALLIAFSRSIVGQMDGVGNLYFLSQDTIELFWRAGGPPVSHTQHAAVVHQLKSNANCSSKQWMCWHMHFALFWFAFFFFFWFTHFSVCVHMWPRWFSYGFTKHDVARNNNLPLSD